MSLRSILRVSAWLTGSALALLLTDLILIVFVSATDILLGQPPQFMFMLFALVISACALTAIRRWSLRSQAAGQVHSYQTAVPPPVSQRAKTASRTPAFVSTTVIRRAPVHASTPIAEQRSETIQ